MRGWRRVELGEPPPWDRWARRALEAGLDDELIKLGRGVIKNAYEDNWDDKLCVVAGWRFTTLKRTWVFDGQALIDVALKQPRYARLLWLYLLKTEGELEHLVDGKWVPAKPAFRPPGAWAAMLGAQHAALVQLKELHRERRADPEVGDIVSFSTTDLRRTGTVTVASVDADAIIIAFREGDRKAPTFSSVDLVRVDGPTYRERRNGGAEFRVEFLEAARRK